MQERGRQRNASQHRVCLQKSPIGASPFLHSSVRQLPRLLPRRCCVRSGTLDGARRSMPVFLAPAVDGRVEERNIQLGEELNLLAER